MLELNITVASSEANNADSEAEAKARFSDRGLITPDSSQRK